MYITKETGSEMTARLRQAAPQIQGKEADELLATLDETVDFKGMGAARAALEIAAIDLATKTSQAPFSQVFGGRKRNAVTLDGPIGLLPYDEAIKKAETLVDQGVSAPSR